MKDITLVIPAKFEAESLPKVLNELKKYPLKKIIVMPKNDILTLQAIKKFNCKIIFQKKNGYGSALTQGILSVKTKYFCIFNADGAFNPKYLKKMRNKLDKRNDFIFNTRYEKGAGSDDDTYLTYIGNQIFTFVCNLLFQLNISDVLFTYVMGSTKAFRSLKIQCQDFSFCVELPIKAKFMKYTMICLPSYERPRIAGKKKVNEFKDGFLILMSILRLFIFKK
jgi:glycosyltransferase involved in cell wall biosynthesis|tara:strand:- start:38 stop:706 length:669 start_codon:yes stop_codon:yes gene_type:complete